MRPAVHIAKQAKLGAEAGAARARDIKEMPERTHDLLHPKPRIDTL